MISVASIKQQHPANCSRTLQIMYDDAPKKNETKRNETENTEKGTSELKSQIKTKKPQ